ncbi:methyltransferase domain-containing protein [Paenibacillus sp. FSL W8-1187]|uniref:methyltransferase domain-containing protein n=1 Tax=Paenibacillus sp. FSL W8-1187 TaxID=2975339 RepID=UPI0030D9F03C
MRIDLGCGAAKHPGCIGIDTRGLPDVDLVHDFDTPLPLSDDSVDFAMLADSAQFSADPLRLMKELYRVCRHGAVVCIAAPYAHASSHLANPAYRSLLSEQSPRYWTSHPVCYVDPDEYRFCAERSWSLQGEEAPDLRLVRLEFFYYPQYEGMYEPHELSLLRQSQMNVAHHFMMHLIVVKQSVSEDEMQWLSVQPMEEPSYVQELRFPVRSGSEEPFLYPGPMELMMSAAAPSAKESGQADVPAAEKSSEADGSAESSGEEAAGAHPQRSDAAADGPDEAPGAGAELGSGGTDGAGAELGSGGTDDAEAELGSGETDSAGAGLGSGEAADRAGNLPDRVVEPARRGAPPARASRPRVKPGGGKRTRRSAAAKPAPKKRTRTRNRASSKRT